MTFTPISDLGEFGLIDKILPFTNAQENPHLLKGIGDDAAVFEVPADMVQVLTTDALIEGVHFDRTFTPLRYLGFKAISVNVSDVCAMNAVPKYLTVALGLPHNMSVEMVEDLYAGMQRACELYNVQLIGGDTTASKQLVLSISAIGFAAKEAVVYRSGAKAGDVICVSGDVGAAYAGLKVLLEEQKAFKEANISPDLSQYEYILQRHFTPTARLDVLQYLADM
jgi:thiamine-monophosphate kinase